MSRKVKIALVCLLVYVGYKVGELEAQMKYLRKKEKSDDSKKSAFSPLN